MIAQILAEELLADCSQNRQNKFPAKISGHTVTASMYVSRFAVEEVSASISRAAKELGYRQLKGNQYQAV